jgi:para-nitrobenzyl esterase
MFEFNVSCRTKDAQTNAWVDPIKIDTGYISGTAIGDVDKEVHVYRGIPYAAPPIGDLRWKPPQPAKPWTGIRECTVYGNSPPQISDLPIRVATMPLSEDCLYLNVLTHARDSSVRLPVMVWMHGGGYTKGDGSLPVTNLPRLPKTG